MSNQLIQLEVFPTTASCAAGCSHCPLSRRLGADPSGEIHPEVLATSHLIAQAAAHEKKSIALIYAGHIDSLGDHFLKLIHNHGQVTDIRFGYDPKDTRTYHQQVLALREQVHLLNQHAPKLELSSFSGTIYPKSKFHPNKAEQKFLVRTLKAMAELEQVNQKRTSYAIDLHANMIHPKQFFKKFDTFEARDIALFDRLHPDLQLFGQPMITHHGFTVIENLGMCFTGLLNLAGFDRKFTKNIEVRTRYITKTVYATEIKERDKQVYQGKLILSTHSHLDTFSPTPEGVMVMHSSQWVTNPIIWISHAEFREVINHAMKLNISLNTVAKGIITSNLKLMEETPKSLSYMKSMQLFQAARKTSGDAYAILKTK
jgi:hypothetical protein